MKGKPLPIGRNVAGSETSPRWRYEKWKVFGPGFWGGKNWTAADLRQAAENYRRFLKPVASSNGAPFHEPFVSLNHNDGTVGLMEGDVCDCGIDPSDGWFWVTFDTNDAIKQAIDKRRIRRASVEFWDTRNKTEQQLSGFPLTPDGKPCGVVFRCLSLLGAAAPGVKGQPDPPKPRLVNGLPIHQFDDSSPRKRITVEIAPMDELIAKLKAMMPGLTDDQYADAAQSLMGATPPENEGGVDMGAGDMGADPMPPAGAPDELKQIFRDVSTLRKEVVATKQKLQALESDRLKREVENTKLTVDQFCDRVKQAGASPAECDRLKAELTGATPTVRELSMKQLAKAYRIQAPTSPSADYLFQDGSAKAASRQETEEVTRRVMASTWRGKKLLAANGSNN